MSAKLVHGDLRLPYYLRTGNTFPHVWGIINLWRTLRLYCNHEPLLFLSRDRKSNLLQEFLKLEESTHAPRGRCIL